MNQAIFLAELAVVDDQYLLAAIPTNPFSGRVSHVADPAWPRLTRLSSSRIFGRRHPELYPQRFVALRPLAYARAFCQIKVLPGEVLIHISPVRLSVTQSPLIKKRGSGHRTPVLNSPSCPVPEQSIIDDQE
jgi:hypothetical protein